MGHFVSPEEFYSGGGGSTSTPTTSNNSVPVQQNAPTPSGGFASPEDFYASKAQQSANPAIEKPNVNVVDFMLGKSGMTDAMQQAANHAKEMAGKSYSGFNYGDTKKKTGIGFLDQALNNMGYKGTAPMSKDAKAAFDTVNAERKKLDSLMEQSGYVTDEDTAQANRDAIDAQRKVLAEAEQAYQKLQSEDKGRYYSSLMGKVNFDGIAKSGQNPTGTVNKIEWAKTHPDNTYDVSQQTSSNFDNLKYATEDETNIYNYLLGLGNVAGADEFLEYIQPSLNARAGNEVAQSIANDTGASRFGRELAVATSAGLEGAMIGIAQNFSDDALATPSSQFALQGVSQDISKRHDGKAFNLEKVAVDTVNTMSNMLPSMLAGTINPALGAITIGASTKGRAYQGLLNQGYGKTQAGEVATILGVAEAATHYLIGGVSALGGKLTGVTAEKLTERITSASAKAVVELGIDVIGEDTDEWLQNKIEAAVRNAVLYEDNDIKFMDADDLYTIVLTTLTTALLQAPATIINTASDASLGRSVIENKATDSLISEALNATDDHIRDLATRMSKNENLRTDTNLGELAKGLSAEGFNLTNLGNAQSTDNTATATAEAEAPTAQVSPEARQAVGDIISKGRVNNTDANTILNNPELKTAFEQATGRQLNGTTVENRKVIQDYAKEMAFARGQAERASQGYADYMANNPAPVETSAETQMDAQARAAEQAARQAEVEARQTDADFVRNSLENGCTVAEAKRILDNPALKAMWEDATNTYLPDSRNKAVKIIRSGGDIANVDVFADYVGADTSAEVAPIAETAAPTQPTADNTANINSSLDKVNAEIAAWEEILNALPESQRENSPITAQLEILYDQKEQLESAAKPKTPVDILSEIGNKNSTAQPTPTSANKAPTGADILADTVSPRNAQQSAQVGANPLKADTQQNANPIGTQPLFNAPTNLNTNEEVREGKFSSNTLDQTQAAAGIPKDNRTTFEYQTKSEARSVLEAAARLATDRSGETQRLIEAEAWSGTQTDMAARIERELYESGDVKAHADWVKIMNEHAIETGRGVQANAKYTRQTGQTALENVINLLNANENLTEEQRNSVIEKANKVAHDFDAVQEDILAAKQKANENDTKAEAPDSLLNLIRNISKQRNTGTFFDSNLDKLLNSQKGNVDYLNSLAYNQIIAMANDVATKRTFAEKVKSFQTLAQLTSIATFNRNIGGNVSFGVVDALIAQDGFGVALDWMVSKATGKRSVALDASWLSSSSRKGAMDGLQKSVLEVALDVDMGGTNRYGRSPDRTFKMSGNGIERFFSRWEQLLSYSLTSSDRTSRGQMEAETTRSLNNLKNSGLTDADIQSIAKQTADYRLFQNQDTAYKMSKGLHDVLNVIGFGGQVNGAARQGGFGVGDIVNTYPGVPANLGVKALEYSPANIVKGGIELVNVIKDARSGNLDAAKQNKAVMDVARGMAGVPAVMLFAAAFKSGLIHNWDDEDDYDVAAQNKAEGKTGVQVNWDAFNRWLNGESAEWKDGDSLDSIGWLEPINAFVAIGSLIANEDEDATKWDMCKDWATGALQAVGEIPVMSNIANAIDSFRYSKADTIGGKVADAAINYAGSSATGFIPSPVRGISTATDDYQRDTKGDSTLDTVVNSFKATIPGLRETLPTKTDGYGNVMTNDGSVPFRLFNTMVNPGNKTTLKQSDVSAEVERVRNATGIDGIYPDRKAPNSVNLKLGEDEKATKLELGAEDKREYHKVAGEMTNKLYSDLMNNPLWDSFNYEQKADLMSKAQTLAETYAKMDYADKKGLDYTSPIDLLISGIDKSGTANDVPPVEEDHIPDYLMIDSMFDVANKSKDSGLLDTVLDAFVKMSDDIKDAFREKTDGFKTREKAFNFGIYSEDFEQFKKDKAAAADIFDKTDGENGVCELYAIGNLPVETQQKIFEHQADLGWLSQSTVAAAKILTEYGYNYQDAANFVYTAMWDGREGKNVAATGSMNGLQCAAALAQIPDLTDSERSQIFNKFKSELSTNNNDWGNYTYEAEIKYIAKNGYTTGRWGDMSTVSNITRNK